VFRSTDTTSDTPINELNPAAWIDFTAPRGQPLSYRIVAINALDDNSGASLPTDHLTLEPLAGSDPHSGNFAMVASISGENLQLEWFSHAGYVYQLESSDNFKDWTPSGPKFTGEDNTLSHKITFPINEEFYRLIYSRAP
jgi:hypothetical protein